MTVVGLFKHAPIALAIDVFPTPGGPVNKSTIPVFELILLFFAMNSKILSFVSYIP